MKEEGGGKKKKDGTAGERETGPSTKGGGMRHTDTHEHTERGKTAAHVCFALAALECLSI